MSTKIKNIVNFAVFCVIVLSLSFTFVTTPDTEVSISERRPLKSFDEVVKAENPFAEFEGYFLDQFPFRESFRTIKAITTFYVFGKNDNNGIYVKDGYYATKPDHPLNESEVSYATDRFSDIYNKYFKSKDVNIYMTVVPDKSYYLAEKYGYPTIDYDRMVSLVKENMPYANYIDISGELDITDYYFTDTHWRQEKITGVAEKITSAMGTGAFKDLKEVVTDVPFRGVYYGQTALPMSSESISYLTNDILKNCKVSAFDSHTNKIEKVEMYSQKHLNGKDPYEVFLYGNTPIVTIENPAGQEGKELVVFRDSFGSSISPLLVKDYAKVTLFDTRYMSPDVIRNYLSDETDDVLFLYSSMILNSSNSLRK